MAVAKISAAVQGKTRQPSSQQKEDEKRKLHEGDAPREKPQLFRSRFGAEEKGIFPRVMLVCFVIGNVIPSVDQQPERKSDI